MIQFESNAAHSGRRPKRPAPAVRDVCHLIERRVVLASIPIPRPAAINV